MKRRENTLFFVTLVTSSSFCLFFSKFDLEFINPYRFADLGHQLHNYELTLQGKLPYADFWTNWWGPASFYLNAIAFKILGTSIYSVNILLAVFTAISATALYCISARIVPGPLALAVALISLLWGNFTLNFPYSGWYANCFGLLALLSFIKYIESENGKQLWLMAAGLALGLDFSSKQHIGVLNAVAIAVSTALSYQVVNQMPGTAKSCEMENSKRFRYPMLLLAIALIAPGSVIFPFFILKARFDSGLGLDPKTLLLFFLPVFVVNAIVLALFSQAFARSGEAVNFKAVFLGLVKREAALVAGFAVAVVPWFVYFSSIIGWRDFYKMILLVHPIQQNFKRAYFAIMPAVAFPPRSILFYLLIFLICSGVASMFIVSRSRRALRVSFAASIAALILCGLLIFPDCVAAVRAIGLPSDFDPAYYANCESPALIGPMLYLTLILGAVLLVAALVKYRDDLTPLARSRTLFLVLTLGIFNCYNSLSLVSFADRAHFQMTFFSWLPLVGYVFYVVYRKLWKLMVNPNFAAGRRKAGILSAVAVFFLVLYAGKPLFIYYLQYKANVRYCDDVLRVSGASYKKTLTKVRGDRGGVYISSAFNSEFKKIIQYLEQNTGKEDFLFGAPSTGLFNFLADRKYPSKYCYLMFNSLSDDEKHELLSELEASKPKLVIYDDFYEGRPSLPRLSQGEIFSKDFGAVNAYISANYQADATIERFHIYKRAPTDSLILLDNTRP